MKRQTPAAIVRTRVEVDRGAVHEATMVELVQEIIARAKGRREAIAVRLRTWDEVPVGDTDMEWDALNDAGRDLSLAITHLEDARTRINAAGYRTTGRFSISDAERL
jgi:hypothetical protein